MTAEAERALVLDNQRIIVACMRIVAAQALSLRERRMNAIIGWYFHEVIMALFA